MPIDLKRMLEAGVHFGHRTSRWSPKMKPFLWGAKNKVHLIDVSKTAFLLDRAGTFLKNTTSNGGKILFVGTKKPAQGLIQKLASSVQMPYVIHRWVGGTLSNYEQVKKAVTRLLHMRDVLQKSASLYKKKEVSMIQKEIARLEKNVGGIVDFDYPPSALVVIDAKKESSAVKEASRLGIPVVAIVDTNTDPDGIAFIIPANDDSPKSVSLLLEYLEEYILQGVKECETKAARTRAEQEAARQAAKDQRQKTFGENQAAMQQKEKAAPAVHHDETKKAAPHVAPAVRKPAPAKKAEAAAPHAAEPKATKEAPAAKAPAKKDKE